MSPCKKCTAKCCKYFAFQIDTPKNKNDFENVRWYLAHKNVKVFIEKRKWYMDIANSCRYLDENHRCQIYEKRPLVCREHDTTDCERGSGKFDHDYVFRNMEEFDKYLRVRFSRRK